MNSKEKALMLAERRGYSSIQSILQVKKGVFVAYNSGKGRNTELFIDVNQSLVREVEWEWEWVEKRMLYSYKIYNKN